MPSPAIPATRVLTSVLAPGATDPPSFWWRWEVPPNNPVVVLHAVIEAAELVRPLPPDVGIDAVAGAAIYDAGAVLDEAIRWTRTFAADRATGTIRRIAGFIDDSGRLHQARDTADRATATIYRIDALIDDSDDRADPAHRALCDAISVADIARSLTHVWWWFDRGALDATATTVCDTAYQLYGPDFTRVWLDRCARVFAFADFDAIATDPDTIT